MNETGNRFALRNMTRDDHERLDALVGHFGDRRSYARYVTGMAVFRGAIERKLANVSYPPSFGAWRPGAILPALLQDLADLAVVEPPVADRIDVPTDEAGLLGTLYVLEGSSLGARVLVRRAAALGFNAEHGARHLAAQTARPASWTEFVALLDGMASDEIERAAQAARMTFAAAIDAFGGIGERERAG